MRLYLSSYKLGNQPDELLKLLPHRKKTAIIHNAVDYLPDSRESHHSPDEVKRLEDIGLEVTEVDLRDYFGKTDELRTELSKYDLVWARGGNSFVLRRAFVYSGADEVIGELLKSDAIVYGGYSAGIDQVTPHLRGIELVDSPNEVPEGYKPEVVWEGMGILPYCIAPHYKSDHPESADIDKTVEYYIDNHIPFVALRDGEVIVINGDEEKVVS